MKRNNEGNYVGFCIPKIWQILKCFARSFPQAQISYFCRVSYYVVSRCLFEFIEKWESVEEGKCNNVKGRRGWWDLFWRKFMKKPVSTLWLISWPTLHPPACANTTTYSPSARNVEERRPEEILMAFTMMEIMIMFSSRNGLLRTPIKGLRKQCKPPP